MTRPAGVDIGGRTGTGSIVEIIEIRQVVGRQVHTGSAEIECRPARGVAIATGTLQGEGVDSIGGEAGENGRGVAGGGVAQRRVAGSEIAAGVGVGVGAGRTRPLDSDLGGIRTGGVGEVGRGQADAGIHGHGEPASGSGPGADGVGGAGGGCISRHDTRGGVEEHNVGGGRGHTDLGGHGRRNAGGCAVDQHHLVGVLVELELDGQHTGTRVGVVGRSEQLDSEHTLAGSALEPILGIAVAGHVAVAAHGADERRAVVVDVGDRLERRRVARRIRRGSEAELAVGADAELRVAVASEAEGEPDVGQRRNAVVARSGVNNLGGRAGRCAPLGCVDTRAEGIAHAKVLRRYSPGQTHG